MGTWAALPWDNDAAADWYGDLMEKCKVREEWLAGIHTDCDDDPEVVRAAIGLFILLGRVYIWPIDNYDSDLELAISKAKNLLENESLNETPEVIDLLAIEIAELESRRKSPSDTPRRAVNPWWKFWQKT